MIKKQTLDVAILKSTHIDESHSSEQQSQEEDYIHEDKHTNEKWRHEEDEMLQEELDTDYIKTTLTNQQPRQKRELIPEVS